MKKAFYIGPFVLVILSSLVTLAADDGGDNDDGVAHLRRRGDAVAWERAKNDVLDTVICASDADCAIGRCRLLDTGGEIVFADDEPAAFAGAAARVPAMKAQPECDAECVPEPPKPSVVAPPLAVCDDDYER
ncbi:MAG: hypothetical protein Q8O67_09510 [Deltaproteobacteria bacterium]|nr:hypothetical protein [Deltaproteobacteria bacterium]